MSKSKHQDPWLLMVERLELSKTEAEIVKRYQQDPMGRSFLPVADILRSHKLTEEALELLMQGVQRHPGFAVARVVLARELFAKGMLAEAWRALDESPGPLADNVLAQKLRCKMAVLLGDEENARSAVTLLRRHQALDQELKRLADNLDLHGITRTRTEYCQELAAQGFDVQMMGPAPTFSERSLKEPVSTTKGPVRELGEGLFREELDEGLRTEIAGYHVVPLQEIFQPTHSAPHGADHKPASHAPGIELDSATLAEIFAKQGYFGKALAVYRRLLRMSPHNDLLRLKVAEMTKLDREHRDTELKTDEVAYERLEAIEIIDRQIKYYDDLLQKLI